MTKNLKLLLFFSGLYFLTRLVNLTSLPVFCDEAIYLRWSQIMKSLPELKFVPVSDGKQPLFMWLTVPFLAVFRDPLFAGRFLSVLAGWGSLLTIFFLAKKLFDQKTAVFSVLLYLFLPFSFFFDRLALADNLLSFFGLLSLYFSLKLADKPNPKNCLVLGTILGLSWLTKSPAIYFIALSVFSFVLIRKSLPIYPIISAFIAFCFFNLLRLGPEFYMIGRRNLDYVWPLADILRHPFDPLRPHLLDVFRLYFQFISLPLFLFSLFSIKNSKFKIPNSKFIILFSWWLLPLLANAAIAKVFTARYILFTLPPLIILLSAALSRFSFPVLLILLLPNLFYLYQLSFHPFQTTLPPTESGYTRDWTSGWGISQAAAYLRGRSLVANIIVGTEGSFGTLPNGLQIYVEKVPHLTIIGTGLAYTSLPEPLINARNYGDEVYLLLNQSRLDLTPDQIAKLDLVNSYPKPDGDRLLLFRFK